MSAPLPEASPQASPARLVLTLTVAGLLAGLILAVAYRVTLPIIKANQAKALREAVFQVLPGSTSMQALTLKDNSLQAVGEGADPDLFAGYDDQGGLVGYAIPSEGSGFQDTIKLLYGYDPTKKQIVGMQILDSRETPGLGDKIYKDPEFRKNFLDLDFSVPLELVKESPTKDNEVDAITGATISSKAVVRIINDSREKFKPDLPTAEQAPPPKASPGSPALPPGGPVGVPRAGSQVEANPSEGSTAP